MHLIGMVFSSTRNAMSQPHKMACRIVLSFMLLLATTALQACLASGLYKPCSCVTAICQSAGCELCQHAGQLLSMMCCAVTSTIALQSSSGPSRMSSCWVTAPMQCSPTWAKVAAWPLRTPTSWPRTCNKIPRPLGSPGSTWKGSLWYDLHPDHTSLLSCIFMLSSSLMTCPNSRKALMCHPAACYRCTLQGCLCKVCRNSFFHKNCLMPFALTQ